MNASELWTALTTMPRPHRIVDFPRNGEDGKPMGQVALRALTQQEQLQSGIAAEKLVRKELAEAKREESIGYEVSYANAVSVEQLWRSCRCADDLDRPAFPSARDMRMVLTTDEIGALYSAFLDVCAEIGPLIGALTLEETDSWVKKLVEGGEQDALPFFSSEALRTLVRTLVVRLRTSRTEPSSAGSPPDDIDMAGSNEADVIGSD